MFGLLKFKRFAIFPKLTYTIKIVNIFKLANTKVIFAANVHPTDEKQVVYEFIQKLLLLTYFCTQVP